MNRLASLILIVLAVMTAACTQSAQSLPDNQENRATLAKQYLEVMPPKEMLQGVANRVTPTLPDANRKIFTEVITSPELEKTAYRIMLDSLVKNFTVPELKAMLAFYGSPAGQSAWKKFSPYMDEVMPPIQKEVREEVRKRMEAEKPPESKEAPTTKPQAGPSAPKEQKAPAGKK